MKLRELLEYKKDRRAPKFNIKPRNPVAHAAQKVAKGSGAHKDKKKAAKQGDVKHKGKLDVTEAVSFGQMPSDAIRVLSINKEQFRYINSKQHYAKTHAGNIQIMLNKLYLIPY